MIECFAESAAWFPRLTETTQYMTGFEFLHEVLRGHYANLWKRSLIRIGLQKVGESRNAGLFWKKQTGQVLSCLMEVVWAPCSKTRSRGSQALCSWDDSLTSSWCQTMRICCLPCWVLACLRLVFLVDVCYVLSYVGRMELDFWCYAWKQLRDRLESQERRCSPAPWWKVLTTLEISKDELNAFYTMKWRRSFRG